MLNLFIVSGSSMWTLMGAVFVPLFALLGFEPGFVQAAFRVGDSATQVITPMNPYIWIFLVMLKRYEPEAGLGTVISRMLPFVVPFWISWVMVLTIFYFTGADVGPGVGDPHLAAPSRGVPERQWQMLTSCEPRTPSTDLAHRPEPALGRRHEGDAARRPPSSGPARGPSPRRAGR